MSADPTPTRHLVCKVDDLEVGTARRVVVEGIDICLVHCANGFYAIGEWCSHADYALSLGDVDPDACEIECPQHGSLFSLVTGEAETLPATLPVPTYVVEVQGDDVFVVIS